jgi:thioredoxin-related protein
MRISIWTLCLFLSVNYTNAQTSFNDYNWKELLKKAETEQKLIFIDAYTDWCGWCKVMDKNTFSDSAVGQLMNTQFVNTKLEMEKSKLGIQLAMKYSINSYPSFLILNQKGQLIYTIVGYRDAEHFIPELNAALDKNNHLNQPGYSIGLNVDYPDFYKNVFISSKKKKFPDSLTVANYLNKNDITKEASWQVAKRFYFQITLAKAKEIAQDKEQIIAQFGKEEYYYFMSNIAHHRIYKAQKDSSFEAATAAIAFGSSFGNFTTRNEHESWLFFYREGKDFEKAAAYFELIRADTGKVSTEYINGLAWDIFLECDDLEILNRTIAWIDAIPESEMKWNIWDTQASLYYKSNQSEKAQFAAKKAIEMAKLKGENAKDTEALLEKINQQK